MSSDLSRDGLGPPAENVVPLDDGRHSLTRNLVAMMSSQVVSWILGLVTQIIQPRFLGPEGLGQIQLAFSLWIVAQVFVSMGTSMYLTLEMARDRRRGAHLVGPIMMLRLGTFAIAAGGMAVYATLVGLDGEMKLLLAITGVTMLLNSMQDVLVSAVIGLEQMGYVSIATVTSKFFFTVVMVVVLVSGGGVTELAYTTIFNGVLALGMMVYFYRRLESVTFRRPPAGYRSIVRRSMPFMASAIILTLYLQMDMVVMSLLVGDEVLGWYTSADILVASLLFVPSMILIVLFPMFGRLHTTDVGAIGPIVRRAFWVLLLFGVSGGFGLSVVSEQLAVRLFGPEFRETGEVLAVFALALPLIFVTMLLGQVALATGRESFWNRLMAVAVLMSVAFDVVFVPVFDRATGNGAIAGALGYVVTESFMVVVALRRIAPELLSGPSTVKMAKIVTAGGVMFVVAWQFRDFLLPVPVAIGAATFVATALAFRILSDDDREMIDRLADRVGIKMRLSPTIAAPDEGGAAADDPDA